METKQTGDDHIVVLIVLGGGVWFGDAGADYSGSANACSLMRIECYLGPG